MRQLCIVLAVAVFAPIVARHDPLRIDLMETVDPAFALSSGTVPQPATFLELISAQLNSPNAPLEIVSQRTIDGYGTQSLGGTKLIAVSGTNFRLLDAPSSGTATCKSSPDRSRNRRASTTCPSMLVSCAVAFSARISCSRCSSLATVCARTSCALVMICNGWRRS